MRATVIAAVAAASFLPSAVAFLPPTPLQQQPTRSTPATTRMALGPDVMEATSNLVAIVKENDVFVKQAGEYPWGSVQAPEWALPVAAIATLSFGVLIPLFLKSGVEAFNAGENAGRSKAVETTVTVKGGKPVAGKPVAGKAPTPPAKPVFGAASAKAASAAKPLTAAAKAAPKQAVTAAKKTFGAAANAAKKAPAPPAAPAKPAAKKFGLF